MTTPRPTPIDPPPARMAAARPARSSLGVGLGVGGLCLVSLLTVLSGLRGLRFEQLRSGERGLADRTQALPQSGVVRFSAVAR